MLTGRINAFEPSGKCFPNCNKWMFDYNWNSKEKTCPNCGYDKF